MSNLNILIVEGNIREDSEFFIKAAGASAADNLKNLILKLEPSTNTDIINPCLLYTSPSPRDLSTSRMPSSA